jgi:hypothetical protein
MLVVVCAEPRPEVELAELANIAFIKLQTAVIAMAFPEPY